MLKTSKDAARLLRRHDLNRAEATCLYVVNTSRHIQFAGTLHNTKFWLVEVYMQADSLEGTSPTQGVQVPHVFRCLAPRNHTLDGFWDHRLQILGTWTLGANSQVDPPARLGTGNHKSTFSCRGILDLFPS